MSAISFSLLQANLKWEDKDANLRMFSERIQGLKTQVVVLPEMFATGFSMNTNELAEEMDGKTFRWMQKTAGQHKIILTGSAIIRENGNCYNRLIWMLPNGEYGYYDKRHLFAFGNEHEHFSPGGNRFIASVNGWKLNLMVCYDLRFPVWARQSPLQKEEQDPEYDVLVYVANWPERRNTAWRTLLQARAIENQCYVIGVNRVGMDGKGIYHSGNSMVIDPLGEILYHREHEEDVFTITLDKETLAAVRTKFPFLRDADPFLLLHDRENI